MTSPEDIYRYLAGRYVEKRPHEAVRFLEQQSLPQIISFLGQLEKNPAALLIERLNPNLGGECLEQLPPDRASQILALLPPDGSVEILRFVSRSKRERLLGLLPETARGVLATLLNFPPRSAGALMDPKVCKVGEDLSIGETKKLIRNFPKYDFNYLYLVDREGKFKGRVLFSDFLRADPAWPLMRLERSVEPSISAEASFAEILADSAWAENSEIPVLDERGRILGILHYRTFRDLQAQSAQPLLSPLTLMMEISEASWMGLISAMHPLWEIFQDRAKGEVP